MAASSTKIPRVYCFAGVDGVGKTTLLNHLAPLLAKTGKQPRCVWIRYNHYLTKPVLGIARIMRMTRCVKVNGKVVHKYHLFRHHPYFSRVYIFSKVIDTLIASFFKIWLPLMLNRRIVILCDRWIPDVLIDLKVETGWENPEQTLPGRWLLKYQSRAQVVVLTSDITTLLSRRKENRFDPYLSDRVTEYRLLAWEFGFPVFQTDNPLQTVAEVIDRTPLKLYGLQRTALSTKEVAG